MTTADSTTSRNKKPGLILEFERNDANAKLIFEDDGKTGYAYLIVDGDVSGDVWLYNVGKAPEIPEWSDPESMPFANAAEFVSEEEFDPISSSSEVAANWDVDRSGLRQVTLFLRNEIHAVLRPAVKPGWCRLAEKPGPLARPLHEVA